MATRRGTLPLVSSLHHLATSSTRRLTAPSFQPPLRLLPTTSTASSSIASCPSSLSACAPSSTACFSSIATEYLSNHVKERVSSDFARGVIGGPSHTPSSTEIDQPTISHTTDIERENLLLESMPSLDLSAFPDADTTDPFRLIQGEMRQIVGNIQGLLGVDHPVLSTVAKYFFENEGGKKIRPAMVLLMAHATNNSSIDSPLLSSQERLAEITEMIHTASLLHDDVIDMADTRRGVSSVNKVFGNKLAVLAGDFLLARSSTQLARLRNVSVVELLSTVIEHLVRGEVMQIKHALQGKPTPEDVFQMYLKKTYYKTGSLMANSCMAVSILADHSDEMSDAAFQYGKHIGVAFQLVDDLLDFEGTAESLGKPALNDIKQGLATAPVLFASQDNPALLQVIARKFEQSGDVKNTCDSVQEFDGVERTRQLAYAHGQAALNALATLPPSHYRTALASLVTLVVNRSY